MKPVVSNVLTTVLTAAIICVPVTVISYKAYQDNQPPVVEEVPEPPAPVTPEDKPVGPPPIPEVVVGEMMKLTAPGDRVSWTCVPAVPDMATYGENNEKIAISFREPGIYNVIAACTSGESVNIIQIRVKVTTCEPQTPTPAPEPKPNPEPEPEPTLTGWAKKFDAWLESDRSDQRLKECRLVAAAFREVAASFQEDVDAGKLVTVDEMIARTVAVNKDALAKSTLDWTVFRNSLATEFQGMYKSGELSTMVEHIALWNEIADSLERYAG